MKGMKNYSGQYFIFCLFIILYSKDILLYIYWIQIKFITSLCLFKKKKKYSQTFPICDCIYLHFKSFSNQRYKIPLFNLTFLINFAYFQINSNFPNNFKNMRDEKKTLFYLTIVTGGNFCPRKEKKKKKGVRKRVGEAREESGRKGPPRATSRPGSPCGPCYASRRPHPFRSLSYPLLLLPPLLAAVHSLLSPQ